MASAQCERAEAARPPTPLACALVRAVQAPRRTGRSRGPSPGQLVEEGDQDAARSGAEIDDPEGRLPVRGQVEGGLDHGLRFGPRHQGLGGRGGRAGPRIPGRRRSGRPAHGRDVVWRRRRGSRPDPATGGYRTGDKICRRDAEGRQKEEPGIQGCGLEPGLTKALAKLPQGLERVLKASGLAGSVPAAPPGCRYAARTGDCRRRRSRANAPHPRP